MRPSLAATLLAFAILALALPFSRSSATAWGGRTGPGAAGAVELSTATRVSNALPAGGGLPYQEQGPSLGGLLLRSAGALALVALLALAAAAVAKRFIPGLRGFSASGASRVQLLESKRITPKLTLFVVEFEGRRLLLAQSGDRVVEVGASARDIQSAGI